MQDKHAHNALMAQAEAAVYGKPLHAFNSSDQLRAVAQASPWPAGGIKVAVQFHVIQWQGLSSVTDNTSSPVDTAALGRQLAVLNHDYGPLGVKFTANAPLFYTNENWTADCYGNLPTIYNQVVLKPATQLNVILCDLVSHNGLLG